MDTYLTIMVTVLVATQVIRIAQNTIQLHRQNKTKACWRHDHSQSRRQNHLSEEKCVSIPKA